MKPARAERAAGVAFIAFAILVAVEATTFRVSFLTDPIGPRALPWLGAALVLVGALYLVVRGGAASPFGAREGDALVHSRDSANAERLGRVVIMIVAFVAYALVLRTVGFVLSTTLLVAGLSTLFGGRWLQSLVAAALFSGVLYLLFAHALGVPLPIGALFMS